ncbi:hypothetical protein [Bradyrhizobium sp. 930_D9_N1_4]|uniref:hypothetical protein n=1 Tax=Bradyrhizobium sp. 930_D9_N1_4 TaxID=3240374 RepID=UPI003F8BA250
MNAPLLQPGSASGSSQHPRMLPSDWKYSVLLVLAVLAAYGPMALINDILWDDWVVRAHAQAGTLWELSKQAGSREVYPLLNWFATSPPRATVMMELVLFCVMAPMIYAIIRRATAWSAQEAFWAALLTALVPLNQARFVLVTLTYACSSFCFVLALVLLLRDLETPSLKRRAASVLLLAMAFTTNSFLVLAWLPPAIVAFDAWRRSDTSSSRSQRFGAMIRAVARRAELLLLPPVYWAAKKILEPTYGIYANYNKFEVDPVSALIRTFRVVFEQFENVDYLLPPRADLPQLCIEAAIAIVLLGGLAMVWRLPLRLPRDGSGASRWWVHGLMLVIAAALVISSLFPYVLVGKPPRFNGLWETRNQTTLMLVSGFVIVAVLRLVLPRVLLPVTAAAICAGFLVLDMSVTHRLLADAMEARAISAQFRQQPSPPGTMMFVRENDRDYRTMGRFLPFYELSYLVNSRDLGFSRMALSNREILEPATGTYPVAVSPVVIEALGKLCETHRQHPQFGFADFVPNGQIETVNLVSARPRPGALEILGDAIRIAGGDAPDPSELVRIERSTAPVGGACSSPCCRG